MEKEIKIKIQEIKLPYKIFFYIIFGALWSFSNVGYSFGFLTWIALVPFLFSIKYENFKQGIFFSWIFGCSAYVFHFWWMMNPFVIYFSQSFFPAYLGFLSYFIGGLTVLIVCAYHGIMYAIIYVVAKYIVSKKRGSFFYLIIPVVFTVVDFFFPKLWYDQVGYSQYIFINLSQIADICGVPLLTFLVIGSNCFILIFIECLLYKSHIRYGITLIVIGIIVILLANLYGILRLNQIDKMVKDAPKANIGVVQGNFSGLDKQDFNKFYTMLSTYNEMSKELITSNPDIIIWPESSIPFPYKKDESDFKSVKMFKNVPLLFGTHMNDNDKIYNSMVLLSKDGKQEDQYYKHKLLAFVEGMPYEFMDPVMNLYGLGSFGRGHEFRIMKVNNLKMTVNICYEDIIPDFIRDSLNVKNTESNIIINGTNDSWFGKSIEPMMHLHIAGYRSIENRKTLVRATCTGYSGIFEPSGVLKRTSKLLEKDSFVEEVPLLEIKTIYRMGGFLFVYFLGIIILIVFSYAVFRKIKFHFKKNKIISQKHHQKNIYINWME
jgi:apolipoprotein N-acyltransferase